MRERKKGFDPCYNYSEFVKEHRHGKSKRKIKRIYAHQRRRMLNKEEQ